MKKLLLLALVIFAFGCKKNTETPQTTTDTSPVLITESISPQMQVIIQSFKNMPSQELKRVAYQTLSNNEKYLLWTDNINAVSASFNPAQIALANDLIIHLKQYYSASSLSIYQLAQFRDSWIDRAQKVFTYAQAEALAFRLYKPFESTSTAKLQINQLGGTPDCSCNAGSLVSCGNGYSNSFCPKESQGACKYSSWGCGFGGAWECNNTCYYDSSY